MTQDGNNALQQLQNRLGDNLDAAFAEPGGAGQTTAPLPEHADGGAPQSAAPAAAVEALEIRQIAGTHAGGTLQLGQGSYRLGPGVDATSLEAGAPVAAQFGLTIAPDGTTQLIPSAAGIMLDGRHVTEPTTLGPGQIIDAGSARFQMGVARSRNMLQAEASDLPVETSFAPMPPATKKRGVDSDVMDWVYDVQSEMARSMRTGFTPDEIRRRSIIGLSAFHIADPGTILFGRATVALGNLPLTLPGDTSELSKATREAVGQASVVPSVPLDVDLLAQSIAIVGHHGTGQAIASWLTLCATVMASPDHVGLTILARNSRGDWSWCDALPHSEQRPGRALDIIINDRQDGLGQLPSNGVISIVASEDEVPDGTQIVFELGRNGANLHDLSAGRTAEGVTPIGVSSVFAYDVTFAMAEHYLPPTGVQR